MLPPYDSWLGNSWSCGVLAALDMPPALWWTLSIWMFLMGGAVGSFMNVVVYRVPAGLSIVRPGSFCPHCKHPIRWWHNLPIVGWLTLRGKCYDCGAPISPRYPLVEGVVALLFLLVCQAEVLSDGNNLPRLVGPLEEFAPIALWGIAAYHLLLCCTLVCIALIELDAKPTPASLRLPVLLCGVIAPLFFPPLDQVPFYWPLATHVGSLTSMATAALDGVCGILVAILLAWPTTILARMPAHTASALRASLPLVGAFLGWQAVLVLANATMIVYLITTILGQTVWRGLARVPWSGVLALLSIGFLVFWKPLVDLVSAAH